LSGALRPAPGDGDDWVALSSRTRGFAGLPDAAAEARFVAGLLRARRISGRVAAFDDARALGAWRLLYPLREGDALRAFAGDILRDLPARDRRGELRRTLAVFLDAGGASVEAARLLGIHRNTLAYRLRQIAAITGLDPLEPSTRLSLQLALMALDIANDPAEPRT
jgi:DNA-binding PucR family transcriptional regulator